MSRAGRGHLMADARLEAAAGIGAGLLAWWLLHDAYEKRGRKLPPVLRPFAWW